ncbi:MAG: ABC transporter substrate-binding protein [Lachnospiraceae bacterium]|nr:ABC transporter substrate-binding protein [Lachnospiraceae bacterium]
MKNRKLTALLLAAGMAVSVLAGCAVPGAATAPAAPQEPAAAVEEAAEEAAEAVEEAAEAVEAAVEETAAEAAGEWEGEVDEINLLLLDVPGLGSNCGPIVEKMNEITEKACGVRIGEIRWAGFGDYATSVSLAMASGEQTDIITIMPSAPANFITLMANEQLMDITELMENEGKDALAMVQDYIAAYSKDGRIYGLPPYRNYGASAYLIMKKSTLEELGLLEKAQNLTNWTEVEEILQAVNDNTNMSPIGSGIYVAGSLFGGDAFADAVSFDTLGDQYRLVYTDNEGNVSGLMDNADYRAMQERVKDWYDKGLVYKDLVTSEEHPDNLLKAGAIFSAVEISEMGVETAKNASLGFEVVCIDLAQQLIDSKTLQNIGMAIPVTSQEPEAAVRWINELYTNPELCNLISWGIEGEDYVVEDGVARYPDGIDAGTVRYHEPDYMFGNYFYIYPWSGDTADFRERAEAYLKSAPLSAFLGFTPDQSELQNTVAAINQVYQTYWKQIAYGVWDDSVWDAYKADLEVAGFGDFLGEYQKQLDDWKASNGK